MTQINPPLMIRVSGLYYRFENAWRKVVGCHIEPLKNKRDKASNNRQLLLSCWNTEGKQKAVWRNLVLKNGR